MRARLLYLGIAIATRAVISQLMYGGFWVDIHAPIHAGLRVCRETSRGFQLWDSLFWYGETGGDRGRPGC
ncbi:hypothetical protein ABZ514_21910, partial [Streptomyces pristinaespiralis]